MIQSSDTFRRVTHQVSCKLNEEVAILNLDRAVYFGLQGVGVQIWDALEQPRSVAELCASIVAEFDVSAEACQADIASILTSLQAEGLIEVVQ